MSNEQSNIVETVLDRMIEPRFVEALEAGEPGYACIPEGMQLTSMEEFSSTPCRIRQKIKFSDLGGFISYVNKFKEDRTALFSSPTELTAILDYHSPAIASFCEHEVKFPMVATTDWKAWNEQRGKYLSQIEFVNLIEALKHTIVEPVASELLTAIKAIRATVTHKQVSVIDDDGEGASFQFNRDVSVTSGKGAQDVRIPKSLVIKVRPYVGLDSMYLLEVRVNYRVEPDASGLRLSYAILNYEQVLEAAHTEIMRKVAAETEVTPFAGGAPLS